MGGRRSAAGGNIVGHSHRRRWSGAGEGHWLSQAPVGGGEQEMVSMIFILYTLR